MPLVNNFASVYKIRVNIRSNKVTIQYFINKYAEIRLTKQKIDEEHYVFIYQLIDMFKEKFALTSFQNSITQKLKSTNHIRQLFLTTLFWFFTQRHHHW